MMEKVVLELVCVMIHVGVMRIIYRYDMRWLVCSELLNLILGQ